MEDRRPMDDDATLAWPLAVVFSHLATPARLSVWVPDVAAVCADAAATVGIGTKFALRLRRDDHEIPGTGELIGYEPPWSAAYRLVAERMTYVLRLTCTASNNATRVRIRQADGAAQLAVDLTGLREAIADGPAANLPNSPGKP